MGSLRVVLSPCSCCTGLNPVHYDNADQNQQAACPESPGGRILEEKDANRGGENHFAGHEYAALPAPAIKEALVHQQLTSQGEKNNAKDHYPFHRRGRQGRLLYKFGQGDQCTHGTEIEVDHHRTVLLSQLSDQRDGQSGKRRADKRHELPK